MAITNREREVHLLSCRRTDTYPQRAAIIDEMDFISDAGCRYRCRHVPRTYWDTGLAAVKPGHLHFCSGALDAFDFAPTAGDQIERPALAD